MERTIGTDPMTMTTALRPGPDSPTGPSGLSLHTRIDLCRGIFAALVVLCHAFTAAWAMDPDAPATISGDAYLWLLHTLGAGFYWVMGFFVLSGYCIHQSVDRQLARGQFRLGGYLVARLTRILPLYYAALIFAIAVEALVSTVRDGASDALDDRTMLLGQLFAVHNLIRCYPGFVASWSITNEVLYYVLFGLLASFAAGGRRDRPVRLGLAVCLAVGVGNQVVYAMGYKGPLVLRSGLLFGLGTIWFLGAWVSSARIWLDDRPAVRRLAGFWPIVLVGGVVGYHRGLPIQGAYVASGLAFTLMMIRMTTGRGAIEPASEPRWAVASGRFLGLASYPTYLFHAPFLVLMSTAMTRTGWSGDWRINWAGLTGASLALGAALGWFAERPLMHWRSSFLARSGLGRSPAGPTRARIAQQPTGGAG